MSGTGAWWRSAKNISNRWRIGVLPLIVCLLLTMAPVSVMAQSSWDSPHLEGSDDDEADETDQDDQEIDAELEALGVTGPESYESPQFGYHVDWSDPWQLNQDPDLDPPVTSDETTDPPSDSLRLWSVDEERLLYVEGFLTEGSWLDTGRGVTKEHVEQFEASMSDDELEDSPIESIDLLLSDYDDTVGAVLYFTTWENGDQRISYYHLQVIDDYFVTSFLAVDVPSFTPVYRSAVDAIEIEGEPLFTLFDDGEIEDAVADVLEEIGDEPDDDETPTPVANEDDDSGGTTDGDEAAYLADVRDHVDTLMTSYDRFFEIINGGPLSEEGAAEINETLQLWRDAPDVAAALEAPDELGDLQETYVAYTGALADAADAFIDYIESEEGSAGEDEAIEAFQTASSDAGPLGSRLDMMLSDAGV